MASPPELRVLCFGDSLTAGYASWGAIHHPYQEMLEQILSMAYPDLKVETLEDGVPGAMVKNGFQTRMNAHFAGPKDKKKRSADEEGSQDGQVFDWAIVLGGTNDLAVGFPVEDIFEALKEVWNVPLAHKCKVLALTVPETGSKGAIRERMDARRNKLNDLIKGYKRENFHVFDLNAVLPYHALSEQDRTRYWDDLVHLTPDGYDWMGNKIGVALVSLLAAEKVNSPQRPQKRRRIFKGDDNQFEEEKEDGEGGGGIERGYVVVRRVDLE
ncbi:SGNH hydrolase-type esterase domain-containing protein [Dichotomopilus funicola]|uniref:SGNH hydrolase-type esterase domain-containing protein n=1 Tax=Dichotomopilus funicola TaxID=1934379 RepID=A0AAN6UY66_9PEZI|nr:SGNH hydrolase-type esterase domain-containing protein [Dichotomopilus funicola]